jgi:hypothetical protein
LAHSTLSGDRPGARIAGAHAVEGAADIGAQTCLVRFAMAQDRRHVPIGIVEQLQQPVLDFDVIMSALQGETGRGFERAPAGIVQAADQRFQIDRDHCRLGAADAPEG